MENRLMLKHCSLHPLNHSLVYLHAYYIVVRPCLFKFYVCFRTSNYFIALSSTSDGYLNEDVEGETLFIYLSIYVIGLLSHSLTM
jgi:hypothetical protein